jgi:MraZ protein
VAITLLYGEYELNLDEKGRLMIPVEVRKSLNGEEHGEAFFIVTGDGHPWLYPEKTYLAMVSKLASEMSPADDMLAFDRMKFAMASKVEPDKTGRILVPEKTLRRTGLSREVTLIGVRDHLELWNRAEWEARSEELLARAAEISLKAQQQTRLASPPQQGS